MEKKLYRSKTNKKIAGVCGGVGEYLGVDPTIIRLIWVIIALCAGCGLLAYIIALIIMPDQPEA
ncbi:MAG: PspC domain-containing protein [Clostridia bacterium]|jgi:phage shock protein PspC (stress-responsive transcriptional regulator)|nr:PspC domain-containing protein [Clostridia bacterium]MBR3866006.1 PspC domain-containing protein [Clostridia bacterium]